MNESSDVVAAADAAVVVLTDNTFLIIVSIIIIGYPLVKKQRLSISDFIAPTLDNTHTHKVFSHLFVDTGRWVKPVKVFNFFFHVVTASLANSLDRFFFLCCSVVLDCWSSQGRSDDSLRHFDRHFKTGWYLTPCRHTLTHTHVSTTRWSPENSQWRARGRAWEFVTGAGAQKRWSFFFFL